MNLDNNSDYLTDRMKMCIIDYLRDNAEEIADSIIALLSEDLAMNEEDPEIGRGLKRGSKKVQPDVSSDCPKSGNVPWNFQG